MSATIVFVNGEVITVDSNDTVKQAVAISGNKITAVGSNAEIEKLIDANTKVIDLNGKTLMPGFIDAHLHLVLYGAFQLNISFLKKVDYSNNTSQIQTGVICRFSLALKK